MKDKTTIIAIVGKSGSGKTTLTKIANEKLGVKYVVSYTTRPKRNEEVDGVDHWFVDDTTMPDKDCMLAYTLYGGYHYWVAHDQMVPGGIYTYVINEEALVEMINKFGYKYNFITVYVDRLNIDVSKDRTIRDDNRFELNKTFYDYIIFNDGSFEEFTNNIIECISLILDKIENNNH